MGVETLIRLRHLLPPKSRRRGSYIGMDHSSINEQEKEILYRYEPFSHQRAGEGVLIYFH